MANLDLIVYNTGLLSSQMQGEVDSVLERYAGYDIQTKLAFVQQVFLSASKYYAQYGTSKANAREYEIFGGPPIAEEWNELQGAISDDLKVLYGEQNILYGALNDLKNYHAVENSFLKQQIGKLKGEVAVFSNIKEVAPGIIKWYAGDDFHDQSKVDMANTSATVIVGSVELEREGKKDFSEEAAIAVADRFAALESSSPIKETFDRLFGVDTKDIYVGNGFIGNYHEAYLRPFRAGESDYSTSLSLAGLKGGWRVEFVGAEEPRANVASLLDGNPATWIEYEVCNFPDSSKQLAQWYGLEMVSSNASGVVQRVPWYAFTDNTVTSLIQSMVLPTTIKMAQYTPAGINYDPQKYFEKIDFSGLAESETPVTGAPRTGGVLRMALHIVLAKEEILDSITITPKVLYGKRPQAVVVEVRSQQFDRWTKATPLTGRAAKVLRKGGVGTEDRIIGDLIDINDPIEMFIAENDDGSNTWVLPKPQPVKAVKIVVEQRQSYDTDIGHIVYGVKITTKTTKNHQPGWLSGLLGFDHAHSDTSTSVEEKRVPGGDMSLDAIYANSATVKQGGVWVAVSMAASLLISTGVAGSIIVGGTITGTIAAKIGHAAFAGLTGIGAAIAGALIIGAIVSGFFGSDTTSVEQQVTPIGPFTERFSGWRYAVGIRDIALTATRYKETSEFQSEEFLSPFNIKRVSLTVSEGIPSSKYSPEFTARTEWIEYSFSLDGGNTWHPIAPRTHLGTGKPTVYLVNLVNSTDRGSKYGYVDTAPVTIGDTEVREAYSIKLRAVLKRPASAETFTPRLHAYRLVMEGTNS